MCSSLGSHLVSHLEMFRIQGIHSFTKTNPSISNVQPKEAQRRKQYSFGTVSSTEAISRSALAERNRSLTIDARLPIAKQPTRRSVLTKAISSWSTHGPSMTPYLPYRPRVLHGSVGYTCNTNLRFTRQPFRNSMTSLTCRPRNTLIPTFRARMSTRPGWNGKRTRNSTHHLISIRESPIQPP